ncbi:MAG TPA: hypothetical protein VFQ73_13470 [Flavisolibacter sp.]|nr:hypothetical protein [Flavisolibacter sp.]
MNWNTFIGVTATISMFLPVAAIVYYRLYNHRSLAALMVSYISTAVYNLMSEDVIHIPQGYLQNFGVVNNYLDIPLMLTALLFFCPIKQKQRTVHIVTIVFVSYELLIAILFGFNPKAVVYIMGPGLALILVYAFYLFVRHIKMTIEFGKNAGRTLMLVSILFAYGCYALVYYFYYIQKTPAVTDVFLLYFISTLVSSIIMTIGLHLIRRRLKELQEIKNTRRELALFFNN